jgi:hypothetical protein
VQKQVVQELPASGHHTVQAPDTAEIILTASNS